MIDDNDDGSAAVACGLCVACGGPADHDPRYCPPRGVPVRRRRAVDHDTALDLRNEMDNSEDGRVDELDRWGEP